MSSVIETFSRNRIGDTLRALSSDEALRDRMARIEGRDRPRRTQSPDFREVLQKGAFRRIRALGQFWLEPPDGAPIRAMSRRTAGFLSGMAAAESPCIFLLSGLGRRLSVHIGTLSQRESALDATLRAYFPGSRLERGIRTRTITGITQLHHCHLLPGVPWRLSDQNDVAETEERIDQLVRGLLYGEQWALIVLAQPLPAAQGCLVVDRWSETVEQARVEFQQPGTLQEMSCLGELYLELLDVQLERALRGRTQGNWLTEVYLLSETLAPVGLTVGALSGEESRPEPFRAIPCDGITSRSDRLVRNATWLSSPDLASLIQFPLHEYPGYAIDAIARFDVNSPDQAADSGLEIGWIQDLGIPTGHAFCIEPRRLTSHALIAGTTGSGKTNTVFHLLDKLQEQDTPFLVIEPTKGEYRFLKSAFPDLQVLTLGSNEAPLRVNPFYVPTGVPVQTHLDYLLSLFAASFVLYAPMPYVLEAALHEVYVDKGWDLVSDVCTRDPERPDRAFPTLTDLYHKVDEVVDRLGYGPRIDRDVRAALHARLNSLRVGNKGAMLDTRASLNVEELLSRPQVVEMEALGDDEQKAFLMGLLLTLIYEHYRAAGVQLRRERLRHVTIVEEAHRLLQNVTQQGSRDFANPRANAVQSFCNIIAEIRAYGEGLIVVEQSPIKLAPDVLRNANLKVIHRVVSGDDREALAGAVPLDERQQDLVVSLPRGHAVLFAGGMDGPVMARIPEAKSRMASSDRPRLSDVRKRGRETRCTTWGSLTVGDEPRLRAAFAHWFLSSVYGESNQDQQARGDLVSLMRSFVPVALRTVEMEREMVGQTVPRLADLLVTGLGTMYSLSFSCEGRFYRIVMEQWDSRSRADCLERLLAEATSVAVPPFPACRLCPMPCRFRFFAQLALDSAEERAGTMQLLARYSREPTEATVRQLALNARLLSGTVVDPAIRRTAEGLALCSLIVAGHRAEWPSAMVTEMTELVQSHISQSHTNEREAEYVSD